MLKRILFIVLGLTMTFISTAQLKPLGLNDVISGGDNYKSFTPETISNLKWIPGIDKYSYTKGDTLVVVSAKKGKEKIALNLKKLNSILDREIKAFPKHDWIAENQLLLHLDNTKTTINLRNKEIISELHFPDNTANIDYHSKSNQLAYTVNNNLYFASLQLVKVAVTNDADLNIVNGQTYHRNEFGISKGTFWSPTGNYLAFARKDESMVGDYPLVNIESREASLENIKYPMAGMASHEVSIGIYHANTGKTIFLKTGEPKDQYLTNLTWSPDETKVYIAILNRAQNHMKLNVYNALTGEFISTLFEEKSDKYVEPENAIIWMPNNDDQFLWHSKQDGHNHLYLYDTKGKLKKQLTKGNWDITEFQGFDEKGEHLFYTSTEKSPIERHTYRLNIASGKTICLSNDEGTHKTNISSTGNYILDNWSNTLTPRNIELIEVNGLKVKNLLSAKNPYEEYILGEAKIFTIKTKDNKTDLYCRMITPPNYDASKKYPVVVYVYGGPHVQLIHNKWLGGARMWQYYMAQKGYIAFSLDNRGSAGRGRDFEQVIHRQLGQVEMVDQMQGIEFLKNLPFVDEDRIGVHGWSYGGFMTTSLMTTYPETFKVGVGGGPVIDWKYYEIMYGERYMDTPEENPEGYKNTNLLNKVNNLKGRLLLIHGAIDPTVVWQHSLDYVRECVEQGVQLDYFVYPRHEHNVRGKERVHLMEKVTRYFDDFLY